MPVQAPAQAGVFRDRYPIFDRAIYLNSCSLGALSHRARERVNEYLDLWQAMGASAWYEIWWAALADLRARYARLIGAPQGSVALHSHISSALTSVAESLDYSKRYRVVVTELDFPTIAYQWLAKSPRGVEVVVLDSPDGVRVPLEAFESAIDDRTALVATSHVANPRRRRLPRSRDVRGGDRRSHCPGRHQPRVLRHRSDPGCRGHCRAGAPPRIALSH